MEELMNANETGQVTKTAAEVYDEFFLPALFEQWAARVADAAQIRAGDRVLDVACGTGVLAREAARRSGPAGRVAGLDINDGMLAVAKRKDPKITWKQGRAESLPFDSASFDVVVSQFGLMFFEDRQAAIREMVRVLRPGGRLAVAVWDSLEHTPGYAAMTELLRRLFGDQAAEALRAPFSLGDAGQLRALFRGAGLPQTEVMAVAGTARFPSIQSWVYTDIKGWTLANTLDDAQFNRLSQEAEPALREFKQADGTVAFDAPALIVQAEKP
jgi:ubiquinone/menaquinone biosynthesis C-methylase UbiE